MLNELGMKPRYETQRYLARRGRYRNQARIRRIRETQKRRRKQIVTHTKIAEASRKRRDKAIYSSEKFGTELQSSGEESDVLCGSCKLRDCLKRSARKYEQWVCCHQCEDWFHWNCFGIRSKCLLPEYFFARDVN